MDFLTAIHSSYSCPPPAKTPGRFRRPRTHQNIGCTENLREADAVQPHTRKVGKGAIQQYETINVTDLEWAMFPKLFAGFIDVDSKVVD